MDNLVAHLSITEGKQKSRRLDVGDDARTRNARGRLLVCPCAAVHVSKDRVENSRFASQRSPLSAGAHLCGNKLIFREAACLKFEREPKSSGRVGGGRI